MRPHDLRFVLVRDHLAVDDRMQVFHAGPLRLVVGVLGGLPGLYPLKRDAFVTKQNPKALVRDVVNHPLCHQEVRQLGQAPGRERQAVLYRLGLRDLLDLAVVRHGERARTAVGVLPVQRVETVSGEVVDYVADRSGLVKVTSAVFATGIFCPDNSTICARRPVTTDSLPRRTIRNS
jgi:hypothetical protein